MAGKTGTAQAVALRRLEPSRARDSRDHAWFIAFAPVEEPTIALAVLVEHAGGGGGKFAAPIAKEVLQRWFTRDLGPPSPDLPVQEVRATKTRGRPRKAGRVRTRRCARPAPGR